MTPPPDRRQWLKGLGATLGASFLAACDRITTSPQALNILGAAEGWTMGAQRLIGANALAREFAPSQISPRFRPNGTIFPQNPDYRALAAADFVLDHVTNGLRVVVVAHIEVAIVQWHLIVGQRGHRHCQRDLLALAHDQAAQRLAIIV